jgi:hypothetical protein
MSASNESDENKPAVGRMVIEGRRADGAVFRPSDWAERLSGVLAQYEKDRRMRYRDCLRPITRDGKRCLVVEPRLHERDPSMWKFVRDFATSNGLKIHDDVQCDDMDVPVDDATSSAR